MNKQKPFRALVPLLLNDRVVRWYPEQGEPRLVIEIPMRHYPKGPTQPWVVKHVQVNFDRRVRIHRPYKTISDTSLESVDEVFYVCENPHVSFTDGAIPVIN